MSYIGNTNTTQAFTPAVDFFSGNASTTAFTLSRPIASVAQVQVVVNNVPQKPSDAYTVSGNTITFTSAPSSGTNNIYVYYTSPITQVIAPGQGTVGPTQIDASYALWNKSGSDVNYTAGNVGIGVASPSQKLELNSGYVKVGNGVGGGGGVWFPYSSDAAGRTWRARSDIVGYGDWGLEQSTTQTGTTFATQVLITQAGLFQFNSGYGSVATAYGCRAWVNFNGTGTVAILASGNVTSITDNGTGEYTVNITNAMPDANYAVGGTAWYAGDNSNPPAVMMLSRRTGSAQTTTTVAVQSWVSGSGAIDCQRVEVFVIR